MHRERDPLMALDRAEDWPWAAAALVRRGDASALGALVAAYDRPVEASRLPLLDAMEALGAIPLAATLAEARDPARRRLAARVAALLPDPAHVPALERLVCDRDAGVAAAARAAMRVQVRDPVWRAAVARLARNSDAALRDAAASWGSEG